jgi:peptide/nickel transport system ATP-binding protein
MIKLENVSKIYRTGTFGSKELHAVKNVSFEIKEGETVSLIGESGSGKSTIGKLILRLISISSGTITFKGENISRTRGNGLKAYYRNVQGVFQDPFSTYNPIFKADRIFNMVRDVYFPHCSAAEWKTKTHNALEAVGLNPEHVCNKFPHQLSGGQLQRFLIARALLLESRFLVADEIISMLDASTRIDVLNLLADLKKSRGLSVLFITHDLSLAQYFSERAVILYKGSVVEIGETDKVYENPQHPYTRMLMASVPRLDQKWNNDLCLPGLVEQSGSSLGCIFYDRCRQPDKNESCMCQTPTIKEIEPGHMVACGCVE